MHRTFLLIALIVIVAVLYVAIPGATIGIVVYIVMDCKSRNMSLSYIICAVIANSLLPIVFLPIYIMDRLFQDNKILF